MLTDPLFWLVIIIPVVTFLGLSKGWFTGQAAAILLPILLVQDVISVSVYRRDWSARNLKVLMPGAAIGVAAAWLVAAHVSEAFVRLAIGFIGVGFSLNARLARMPAHATRPDRGERRALGHPIRLRIDFRASGRAAFASVNVMKVIPYFSLGQFSVEVLALRVRSYR